MNSSSLIGSVNLLYYISKVRKFLDSLNLDERISICGEYASDQIGTIFKEIDVLIIPSLCYENYSMVLHEAFESNVPVIATNLGALGEKIEVGLNGFSFSAGDSEDLTQKMLKIIDDPRILNTMKSYIQKNVINPKVEQEAYEYINMYKIITN